MHRVSASAGQEAFFEGHVHAFNVLGGVPTGKIRYDNLKAAVASVIGFSRQRVEADRWTAVGSHYGIEAFYCQPGIQGAHEKGGVEGQIGWFRRNHLVPIPEVDSLDELNAMVDAGPSHKAADNLTPVGRGSGVDANQHPRHRHVPRGVRTRQQAVSDETSAANACDPMAISGNQTAGLVPDPLHNG